MLVACIAGSSVVFLDEFVVNVALPAIQRDLGGGLSGQQWVSNAYLLALGSLLLVGGSLGDVFGERRVFALGVTGFGVMSVVCAIAPTLEALVAARALQGVAGAVLVPSTLAVIVATFGEDERGRAIGTWTAWTGIATVAGPLVGGQIVDAASWRWIFAINVPLVCATLALVLIAMPRPTTRTVRGRVDLVGAVLAALGLAGPVFALVEQPRLGWASAGVIGPLAAGLLLLGAFARWEQRTSHPMMPLSLFRRRNFSAGNLQTLAMYGGMASLFFFLTIFLQQVAGYDAFEAGLASLPTTVVLFVLSHRFGALADRYGSRPFLVAGPLVAAAGMVLLLRVDAGLDYPTELLPALLVFSIGLSMTVAPLTAAVLAGVEERSAGVASGVNNAVARVAELVAIAAIGLVVAARFDAGIDSRLGERGLSPAAQRSIAAAKQRSLGRPDLTGVPAGERRAIAAAVTESSTAAFHTGIGVGGGAIALAGVTAAVGLRQPRRRVRARDCPGGVIVGHPADEPSCVPSPVAEPRT
ncbi:MAG: MFS transporter [Actinomycetota bacterium]|nr:MFS transporter [Actinomycetota bacterium]